MKEISKIRAYINSRALDFYDYLRVFVIDDRSFEILERISDESEVFILCGIIRDFFLNRLGSSRDFDFVFRHPLRMNRLYWEYIHETSAEIRINSFNGIKLLANNRINVDFWQLDNTWGIHNRKIDVPTPNDLIDSVFFNFSAVTYDLNNRKFIFNEHFARFIQTQIIDIVYEENPNIPLCLFNLYYYPHTLGLKISDKARYWIGSHLNDTINFDKVQIKHLDKIIYQQNEIMTYLKDQSKTSVYGIDWAEYLSSEREKQPTKSYGQVGKIDQRTPFESDYGRVVFSSAMRRMHDKTQVIPLTSGDKIHTRLTHSIEVMNTAQSLAINLCRDKDFIAEYGTEQAFNLERQISAILKTAAFVHDIGNPPFGHFGETIIKNFFKKYLNNHILCDKYTLDFEEFDGNAQGFRILTHLSYIGYLSGLNLTYATLAAYLKYPNNGNIDKSYIGTKKHGVYTTEKEIFDNIVSSCHLKCKDGRIKRHPLSFLVEAADSICYNVMDIEDGYLLHWYNKEDILNFLDKTISELITDKIRTVLQKSHKDGLALEKKCEPFFNKESKQYSFMKIVSHNPDYKSDGTVKNRVHWIMEFRVNVIQYLVELASANFKRNIHDINDGRYNKELIEDDDFFVTKALRKFTQRYIFPQPAIHQAELAGHSVLNGLLEILLNYISSSDKEFRKRVKNILSKSGIRVAVHEDKRGHGNKIDYNVMTEEDFFRLDLKDLSENAKLRLVVDFVAGMTDKYAVLLYQKLSGHKI